jgi:hypothetical protein
MNENETKQESVNTERMVNIKVVIDAPPGAPRPDVYMKVISKDILNQEYKNPEYTFMGEWGWEYEIPKSKYEEFQKSVMEYLTKLYYSGAIRYGEFSKVKGN